MAINPSLNSFGQVFDQFTKGDVNAPDAGQLYQSFLIGGTTEAPFDVKQIGPFTFDYEEDNAVEGDNEITDHWVEDNTTAEDHIGVKPTRITLKGKIAELAFDSRISGSISSALATVENKLTQVDSYLGKYTPGTTQVLLTTITQAQNIAVQIQQAAARIAQLAGFFAPKPGYNKQQTAFAVLQALRMARTIFTVYTPFQVFLNMAIESVHADQPSWTKTQSNFTVRMKQLQFTDDISQTSFYTQYGGRRATAQPQTANGITSGVQRKFSEIAAVF